MSLDQLEQAYVHAVLDSVNGNKTEAANILRIDRKTLYRKLEDSSADSSDTLIALEHSGHRTQTHSDAVEPPRSTTSSKPFD